ncbi:VOC family protein [Horticoccus luteus]|uniref:VOC family protein n=1 Tax=Horticoccus luteus TaxID=2862869 RepID=A0A8F9XLR3_9BACT|nr:VOC family protein [Horticoccus luteus]QYM79481.1 VOC family protein [Horticoccus luteus]
MITYQEIAFTAYPVTDIARARKFYEGILGLKPNAPVKPDAKFIEYNIGSGCLAIGSSPNWPPSNDGPSSALEVTDFDAAVATLRQHKVEFVIGPMDTPMCFMATVRDPDGNRLTLHHRKSG